MFKIVLKEMFLWRLNQCAVLSVQSDQIIDTDDAMDIYIYNIHVVAYIIHIYIYNIYDV